MKMRLVITVIVLFAFLPVPFAAEPAWHNSIARIQDCGGYDAIVVRPDGTVYFPENLKGLKAPFPYTRELAFKVLLSTCEFRDHVVSDPNPSFLQVELLNVLWHLPDREQVFEDLYKRGNVPGKLYALIGLYDTHRKRFAELVQNLRSGGGTVVRHSGCVATSVDVSSIIAEIEDGSLPGAFRQVGRYMTWLPK